MNFCSQIALWKRRTLAPWTEVIQALGQARPEPNADTATDHLRPLLPFHAGLARCPPSPEGLGRARAEVRDLQIIVSNTTSNIKRCLRSSPLQGSVPGSELTSVCRIYTPAYSPVPLDLTLPPLPLAPGANVLVVPALRVNTWGGLFRVPCERSSPALSQVPPPPKIWLGHFGYTNFWDPDPPPPLPPFSYFPGEGCM